MTDQLENLRQYNKWRRSEIDDMPHPKDIGITLDWAIAEIERLRGLLGGTDDLSQSMIDEIERLRRGEFICKKCGLRKNDEHPKGDF